MFSVVWFSFLKLITLVAYRLAIIRCRRMKKNSNTAWSKVAGPHYNIQDGPTVSVPLMFPYAYANELSYDDSYPSY